MLLANDKFLQIYTEYQETYYAHTQYKNEGFFAYTHYTSDGILHILSMPTEVFWVYSV